MSFSKSRVQRFNENTGCAPAVGSYNINSERKINVAAMVEKTERFKDVKDTCASSADSTLSQSSSMGELRTPSKVNMSMVPGSERRRRIGSNKMPSQAENGKIKELETKIKHLQQQEAEMGRNLGQARDKLGKVEAKLQAAIKEKSQLKAQLAKSEKQVLELSRSKDVLRNKIETLENTQARHNSTSDEIETVKQQLRKKDAEFDKIQSELTCKVQSLQADLTAAHTTIQALKESKQALGKKDFSHAAEGDPCYNIT